MDDLLRARDAAVRLTEALRREDAFNEDLAREYNRAKKALAVSFQRMALAALPREYNLADVRSRIEQEMRRLFEGRAESSLLRVRGYTSPHPHIYALLASNLGRAVPAWRIRLVSGDQVHTERRTRELRDLGLAIDVAETNDETTYCLTTLEPDLTYAAAYQLRENVIDLAKRAPSQARPELIALAEATAPLPERRKQ